MQYALDFHHIIRYLSAHRPILSSHFIGTGKS